MNVKKSLLVVLVLLVALSACDRKSFVKKIVGTWKTSHYLFAKKDITKTFTDTSHVNFQLTINEDNTYNRSWLNYFYHLDSLITNDTVAYDSVLMTYTVNHDTLRFVDTTITPYNDRGEWALLNSEEDLQLTSDTSTLGAEQYRILKLDKNNLNLLKGNEEFDLSK